MENCTARHTHENGEEDRPFLPALGGQHRVVLRLNTSESESYAETMCASQQPQHVLNLLDNSNAVGLGMRNLSDNYILPV